MVIFEYREQLDQVTYDQGETFDMEMSEDEESLELVEVHSANLLNKFTQALKANLHKGTDKSKLTSRDQVKVEVKRFTRSYSIDYTNWRTKALKDLQRIQSRFLRSKPPLCVRLRQLPFFDQQIKAFQQELTDIIACKTEARWHEQGEKSAKYLKNIHKHRTIQQYVNSFLENSSITFDVPAM